MERQKKMKIRLVLISILVLVLAGACQPTSSEEPKRNDMVICLGKSPLNLDPRYNIDAASFRVTQVMFNGLVKKGPNMTLVPDLAEKWEVKNDRIWTFTLKPGVKFHNGHALTAQDVAYTFRSILDPKYKSPKRQSYTAIEAIETPDDRTVIIHTREPYSPLLVNLTLGIVPRKEAEAVGDDFAQHPIGTGPYRFLSYEADQEIRLTAFDKHFKGKPKIKDLTFRIIPDDTTRYLELIKGNIDFVQNAITPDMVPVVENKKEFQVIRIGGTNYEYLGFNLDDPVLKDRRVRAAIACALDIPQMIQAIQKGLAAPATGILPPQHWAYEGDVETYPYQPDKSRELLDQAGFPVKEDGFRFSLTYKTSLSEIAKLKAEIVQQQLKEVGIQVDIRGYEWATLLSDLTSGNFQIYSLQWVGVSDPDIYFLALSSQSIPPAGRNRGRYVNPKVDALIEKNRRTIDKAERKKITSQIQKIVAHDLPYVSLWYPMNVVIMKSGLAGFEPYPDGDLSDLWKIYWKD